MGGYDLELDVHPLACSETRGRGRQFGSRGWEHRHLLELQ